MSRDYPNQIATKEAAYARDVQVQVQSAGRGQSLAAEAPRAPETERFMGELGRNISVCDEMIDRLESQLERVVRPVPEVALGGGHSMVAPREVAQSQLGANIQNQAERVANLSVRLQQICHRLEV